MQRIIWITLFTGTLIWSGWHPKDAMTWLLEVFPALIGAAIILVTAKRFPLTPLLYWLILVHCIILMVGGHYTYAEVPLFDSLKEWMGSDRNNYDKVGHFAQGFIPAILAREILIRMRVVNGTRWLFVIVVSICLAFSAFYELIEWWVALLSDEAAESFLGTQGYVWDTQSDMAYALAGSIISQLMLGNVHDRQLQALSLLKPAGFP